MCRKRNIILLTLASIFLFASIAWASGNVSEAWLGTSQGSVTGNLAWEGDIIHVTGHNDPYASWKGNWLYVYEDIPNWPDRSAGSAWYNVGAAFSWDTGSQPWKNYYVKLVSESIWGGAQAHGRSQ